MCSNDPYAEVKYDEPTSKASIKLHRDRHLRREENAIRSLDTDAAEKHRQSRAQQRQQIREHEEEIRSCLDFLICRLENQHARAVREQEQAASGAWDCPAGCPSGTDCARAAFRSKLVPPNAQIVSEIQMQLERSWERQHNVRQIGEFTGPTGYHYVRCETQCGMWRQQWEDLRAEGIYRPEFSVSDSDVREVQDAFVKFWDGLSKPIDWLRAWVAGEACPANLGQAEYKPDPPGVNHCWGGCERSSWGSCCYCRGVEPPPERFEVLSVTIDPRFPDTGYIYIKSWWTLKELRNEIKTLASQRGSEPVPPYLIDRARPTIADGRVLCLPTDLSDHVSAEELTSWTAQLALASTRLLVSSCDSHRQAIVDEHLAPHLILYKENKLAQAEWWDFNQAKLALDREAVFNAHRGCGLRISQHGRPAFRRGDLVYLPQQACSSPPCVAVVMEIERSGGFGGNTGRLGFPTGDFRLLSWDTAGLCFSDRMQWCANKDWQLMPPCCGRGCKCPHLFCQLVEPDGTPPQWPNGDDLDPRGLLGLPAAFTAYLQTELRQPVKQQQIALEAAFERLTKNPFAPSSPTYDLDNSDLQQAGLDQACSKRQRVPTEEAAPMKRRFKLDHFGLEFQPTSAAANERDTSISHSVDSDCSDCMSICSNESSSVDWGSGCESDWVSSECDEC